MTPPVDLLSGHIVSTRDLRDTRPLKWSCFSGQVCGSAKVHLGWVSCRLVQSCWFKVCVIGRSFIKSGVGPLGVVKSDPVVDDAFGLEPVLQFIQINGLLLQRTPQSLNEDCCRDNGPGHPSTARQCMFICMRWEILILASVRVVIQAEPVNWEPWSVFIISGLPYLARASFSASTQKLASSVLDNRHASTFRVAQSIIATR